MKRRSKIFAFLATFLLLIGISCILVFASDSGVTNESQYAFKVYNPSTQSYSYYTSDANFDDRIADIPDGGVLTLLRDVRVTEKFCYPGKHTQPTGEGRAEIYLDLNGYSLHHAHTETSGKTFLELSENCNFYVYSSAPGANMLSSYTDATGAVNSYTLFNLRYDYSSLILGKVTAPVVELLDDGKYHVTGYATHSGDNLSTYSGVLASAWYNTTAEKDLQHIDKSVVIDGGTHYKTHLSRGWMLSNESNCNYTVKNATIVVLDGAGYVYHAKASGVTKDQTVSFENCLISAGTIIQSTAARVTVTFNDCYIASNAIATGMNNPPTFDRCHYTFELNPKTDNETIYTNEHRNVQLQLVNYNYNGRTLVSTSPYSFTDDVINYTFTTMDADSTVPTAQINWLSGDEVISEKWLKSDKVTPTPYFAIPNATEIYKYDAYPKPVSTEESGNATYEIKPHANFELKANLALYSDFVYNLYIPKSAVDSILFKSARIDRFGYDGSVKLGTELAVKNGEVVSLKLAYDDAPIDYYVLKTNVPAPEGDITFRLVMTLVGHYGEEFSHIQTFSIFDYVDRVNAGSYSDDAKDMVNATKTYIKAARNYYGAISNPTAPTPYPIEENADLVSVIGTAEKVKKPAASEPIRDVFYGMTLSLESKIKFVFYMHKGFTDRITFTYPINTKPTEVTVSAADCYETKVYDSAIGDYIPLLCYEISMKAIDLRSAITINLSSTENEVDYTYRLANYVESVYGASAGLDALMDSLWAYSSAANKYIRNTTSDTPEVSLSISGSKVTRDSHVIVASESEMQAAELLRNAIAQRTNERLEIVSEKPEGKNAISLSLTTPSSQYDFTSFVNGGDLVMKCSYKSFIETGVNSFIKEFISTLNTEYDFTADFSRKYNTDKIYYSDFGAYGVDMDAVAAYGKGYTDISLWHGDVLATIKPALTNDFFNIKAAHDMANSTGRHTVCADDGKVYYISETLKSNSAQVIEISSPVDFGNANFVIDDSELVHSKAIGTQEAYLQGVTNIFKVTSPYPVITITDKDLLSAIVAEGLNTGTKVIDLGLGYPAMIIPYNNSHNIYRRKGYTAWAGAAMHEILVIDENGNLAGDTPVMFDYTALDKIEVYRLDIPELVINGGTFTTIASHVNRVYNGNQLASGYINRGMLVSRSNTKVQNLVHEVIGEITLEEHSNGAVGANYHGFFSSENASDVTYENCVVQGRRCYSKTAAGLSGGADGTYDIYAVAVNRLSFINCDQSNFWVAVDENHEISLSNKGESGAVLSMNPYVLSNGKSTQMHWGVGGTNYCKNMNYIDSTLSRLDAHAGLYNGSIIDSTINYLSLTGGGEMLVENVEWYASSSSSAGNSIIYLRNDYGSHWDGTITLKNVVAHHHEEMNENGVITRYKGYVVYHNYSNWYYGYDAHYPNVIVDGIEYRTLYTDEHIDAKTAGAINFSTSSFVTEPYMHLDYTKNKSPLYPDVDSDGDGLVDNTDIKFDSVESTGGIEYTKSKKNLNKITPPEKILIVNNVYGYDFESNLRSYLNQTTFFDGTLIAIGAMDAEGNFTPSKIINDGITLDDDAPMIPLG